MTSSSASSSAATANRDHEVFAKANLDFFAKIADEYDDGAPGGDPNFAGLVRKISQQNYEAILRAVPFDPASTEMMDFACGTGMTTLLLAPHCKSVVGVDQSGPMLDKFRAQLAKPDTTAAASLAPKIELVHTDLLAPEPERASSSTGPALHDRTFDIIVCTMSYHHFADPTHVTQVLSRFLKPGGKLVIVDFLDKDGGQGEGEGEGEAGDAKRAASHAHHHHHHHQDNADEGHGHHHHHHHDHAHAHSHAPASSDPTDSANGKSAGSADPTAAQLNRHRVANVIAHASFVPADFDRFFGKAGVRRAGEPVFSAVLEWPGRAAQDLYVIVAER